MLGKSPSHSDTFCWEWGSRSLLCPLGLFHSHLTCPAFHFHIIFCALSDVGGLPFPWYTSPKTSWKSGNASLKNKNKTLPIHVIFLNSLVGIQCIVDTNNEQAIENRRWLLPWRAFIQDSWQLLSPYSVPHTGLFENHFLSCRWGSWGWKSCFFSSLNYLFSVENFAERWANFTLFFFFKLFYMYECPACIYVYTPHKYLLPMEIKSGHWIS